MIEKLKYNVGDKVLIPFEILEVKENDSLPYATKRLDRDNTKGYWTKGTLESIAITLPQKPKVPQAVMDWYEKYYHTDAHMRDVLEHFANEPLNKNPIAIWLYDFDEEISLLKERQHALATLIAHGPEAVELEKEKRYKVTLKATGQFLTYSTDRSNVYFVRSFESLFTEQELIEYGFGDVFDNSMFEVEEVE